MAFPFLNPFKRQNKTDSKQVRSMNAAAQWADDPRLASPVRDTLAHAVLIGQRVAGLAKNDPTVASGIHLLVSMIVGGGTRLNSGDSQMDTDFNGGRFDPSRECSMLSLQEQIIRSWVIYGEGLAYLAVLENEFCVQLLHPDQLDRNKNVDLGGGRRIVAGVELDAYDRRVAYWISPSGDTPFGLYQPSQRFPASDIIHVFEREFPGQIRGISPLTPILPNANTASIAVEAGLKKLQISALLTAFITSQDGDNPFTASPTLEPGAVVRLQAGEDVRMAEGGDAGDLSSFLKLVHHQMAAAIGVTFEDLTGDLSGVNYSSYRAGALTARRKAEARRKVLLIEGFLDRIARRWRAVEALKGRMMPEKYGWIEPSWPEIDPEKAANADVILLDAKLKSRREIIEGRGREFETVNAEIDGDPLSPSNTGGADASGHQSQ